MPYQPERTRWGYPRRGNPSRGVEWVGIADYAPRIERLDRTHQNRSRLAIARTDRLDERVTESISKILNQPYVDACVHTVGVLGKDWSDLIPQLSRAKYTYSESQMGAGEQKIIRLVDRLERLERKCLVLLEEPELTLHGDAQAGLAWYLMSLARRRGHQIIAATHSSEFYNALPPEGRVLLVRDREGVSVLHGASEICAARQLQGSVASNRDLVFVEDRVARRLIIELLREFDKDLGRNVTIIELGGAEEVARLVRRMREHGVRAVGVRDGDQSRSPEDGLFALPGGDAPEHVLMDQANLQRAEALLCGVGQAFERACIAGSGFSGSQRNKRILAELGRQMEIEEDLLLDRLAVAWLQDSCNRNAAKQLIGEIRAGLDSPQEHVTTT